MHLVSSGRVSIFDKNLLTLVLRLQRVKNADYASFCLDRVTVSLKSGGDFVQMFEEEINQAEKQYEGVLKLEPQYLR